MCLFTALFWQIAYVGVIYKEREITVVASLSMYTSQPKATFTTYFTSAFTSPRYPSSSLFLLPGRVVDRSRRGIPVAVASSSNADRNACDGKINIQVNHSHGSSRYLMNKIVSRSQ